MTRTRLIKSLCTVLAAGLSLFIGASSCTGSSQRVETAVGPEQPETPPDPSASETPPVAFADLENRDVLDLSGLGVQPGAQQPESMQLTGTSSTAPEEVVETTTTAKAEETTTTAAPEETTTTAAEETTAAAEETTTTAKAEETTTTAKAEETTTTAAEETTTTAKAQEAAQQPAEPVIEVQQAAEPAQGAGPDSEQASPPEEAKPNETSPSNDNSGSESSPPPPAGPSIQKPTSTETPPSSAAETKPEEDKNGSESKPEGQLSSNDEKTQATQPLTEDVTAPTGAKQEGSDSKAVVEKPDDAEKAEEKSDSKETSTPDPSGPSVRRPLPGGLEAIRNNNPAFSAFASTRSDNLPLDRLLTSGQSDNGGHPDGNFRVDCVYSHLAYDDPIVYPGQPGKAHLHMFFGNTAVDAYTNDDSLLNTGGGSCQGFEANRSGYWTPAVLDGKGNAVIPERIIVYYKSKFENTVADLPQGLKMVTGNTTNDSFNANQALGWSCGGSGTSYNKSNRIPDCGGDMINYYIQFPQCWDGKNLDSSDHRSHMRWIDEAIASCPGSHPVRLPQITVLVYFSPANTNGWYLSSDRSGGFNTAPGATLHADWYGGWNNEAMRLWMNGCMRASRNCSLGQTGTPRQFTKVPAYGGPKHLPLP